LFYKQHSDILILQNFRFLWRIILILCDFMKNSFSKLGKGKHRYFKYTPSFTSFFWGYFLGSSCILLGMLCIKFGSRDNSYFKFMLYNLQIFNSHIYKEDKKCANKLENHGHSIIGTTWRDYLPMCIRHDFFRDEFSLPNYCFA